MLIVVTANGGIGFELAAQLMKKGGYHVLLGARSTEKGNAAAKDLQSRQLPGSVEFMQLDVTDDDSIERAAKDVEKDHGKLDILVNNAAVTLMDTTPMRKQINDCFDANATGTYLVTKAFEELLKNSKLPARVVNISSGAGSIGQKLDPNNTSQIKNVEHYQYRASKAAMNMATACQIGTLEPFGIKVFAFCPGFTASNLSTMNKVENGAKPVAEAVAPIVDIIEGKRDDEAGKFLHNSGTYQW